MTASPPTLSGKDGLDALRGILRERSILGGLSAMRRHLGRFFRITLPGFRPFVLSGLPHTRRVLIEKRHDFLWRNERDPVTKLLRHGVLVEDGQRHAYLRGLMDPTLKRSAVYAQTDAMWRFTGRVLRGWQDGSRLDMLVEMRKVALLILIGGLFDVDAGDDLDRIWKPILRSIDYISPGPWILWPDIPRPGYRRHLETLDAYLYGLIRERRAQGPTGDDLLSGLLRTPEMTDDLIRDQLLTMLIAGHDTSTALLAWALYLLGKHPEAMAKATAEAEAAIGQDPPTPADLRRLPYLDAVVKETLRLYPPIHVGNRKAAKDMEIEGCPVHKGDRVMLSIYLSHRDPEYWPEPEAFRPDRFLPGYAPSPPALAYIPFGGGPRNCIGASFSLVEAKIVLGRILKSFRLELEPQKVHAHMGATLEPRPGVRMRVYKK